MAQNDDEMRQLVTRIDERVSNMSAEIKEIKLELSQLKKEVSNQSSVAERDLRNEIHAIELRLLTCESLAKSSTSKWEMVWDYTIKLGWIIVVAYIFIKLNLQVPDIP